MNETQTQGMSFNEYLGYEARRLAKKAVGECILEGYIDDKEQAQSIEDIFSKYLRELMG